jgi:hypothetical protein
MKQNLFPLFILSLTFFGCSTTKTQPSVEITQGISGFVYEAKGNHMPMKGAPKNNPKTLQCTVLVYEPTNISDAEPQTPTPLYTLIRTKQVASVNTDSVGYFKIQLPVGKYSLFIKQGNQFFANSYDQFNNIALFEVRASSFTEVKLTVNKAATY